MDTGKFHCTSLFRTRAVVALFVNSRSQRLRFSEFECLHAALGHKKTGASKKTRVGRNNPDGLAVFQYRIRRIGGYDSAVRKVEEIERGQQSGNLAVFVVSRERPAHLDAPWIVAMRIDDEVAFAVSIAIIENIVGTPSVFQEYEIFQAGT